MHGPLGEGVAEAGRVCLSARAMVGRRAVGLLELPWVMVLLIAAAILGNQSNYVIGRHFGPRVFKWEQSRFFNRHAFDQAHEFYEKYGGVTIVLARFLPFFRTFAPFIAGVAQMTRSKFTFYDVSGGALWLGSITLAGYLFGNTPWFRQNLEVIVWAVVVVPSVFICFGAWKAARIQSV